MDKPLPKKGKLVPKAWGHELWIHNTPAYCGKLLVFKVMFSCTKLFSGSSRKSVCFAVHLPPSKKPTATG